jgi:hypothetical protein
MPSNDPAGKQGKESAAALSFPDHPAAADQAKMQQRRTLPPQAGQSPTAAPGAVAALPAKRDPLLVALPPDRELMVFELSSFFKQPLGQMFSACMRSDAFWHGFESKGLDLGEVDRVAVGNLWSSERLVVVSGNALHADPTQMYRLKEPTAYGVGGQVFAPIEALPSDTWTPPYVGLWNKTTVLFSTSLRAVHEALDRLDGRTPAELAFPQDEAYSQAYGVVTARSLADAVSSLGLSEQLRRADLTAHFHIAVPDDAAIVLDAQGSSADAREVAKALAAMLAAKRVQAASAHDKRASKLLDLYSVTPQPQGFQLKVAVPLSFLQDLLAGCADTDKGAARATGH